MSEHEDVWTAPESGLYAFGTQPNRWAAFTDDELRNLDHAIGVEDQEYGAYNRDLWQEIKDEILRRAEPNAEDSA